MLEGFNEEVSSFAADVDQAIFISTAISSVMFLLVVGLMVFFIFRYHHSRVKPDEIRNIKDHLPLEISWTVIPTILLFIIFYYGYSAFRQVRTMPEDAFSVDVLGKRWSWTFTYPNGKRTTELFVPEKQNIRLHLHAPANDVLHSFYVPAFRIKEDAVPDRQTDLWFNSTVRGRYDIECAEYCGTGHSRMLSKVDVMDKAAFDAWYASDRISPYDKGAPKEKGEVLYKTLGCSACHSLDGSTLVGPSFKGIYGEKTKVLTGGKLREVLVDDMYIRNSVRTPSKDVVEGFSEGVMPDLSDQISKEQMDEIIEFIKKQSRRESKVLSHAEDKPIIVTAAETNVNAAETLVQKKKKKKQTVTVDGAALFKSRGCFACHSLDGSKKIGPSLKGIYQSTEKVVTDGESREVTVDEAYLHNSIKDPNADIVEGFMPNMMPQFGKILTPDEIDALVEYLKSV